MICSVGIYELLTLIWMKNWILAAFRLKIVRKTLHIWTLINKNIALHLIAMGEEG